MKTLLRIYLVLIFASSARSAGTENELINSGFPIEESNFATNPSYPQNLRGMADCVNSIDQKEQKKRNGTEVEKISE
ncbi:hypothetical protein [Algoriphagus antarcticus]|uniref:Uncharacterized protein n=1 Tax=Algoriphagus antarcticus TaxID=238540 RepID=A0A3E0DK88_9BACT|nr:hypothetical protein [Algoriphagus antarcticus]REG83043.1 hypothetical protein C8N25_1197 [Algoriphagus antarcticus]